MSSAGDFSGDAIGFSCDPTIRVKREPEAMPITFGDAVLLMVIGFWMFRAPAISGTVVFLAFVLAWITNLLYRMLYPLMEYLGASVVHRIIQRGVRKQQGRSASPLKRETDE